MVPPRAPSFGGLTGRWRCASRPADSWGYKTASGTRPSLRAGLLVGIARDDRRVPARARARAAHRRRRARVRRDDGAAPRGGLRSKVRRVLDRDALAPPRLRAR